MSFLPSYIASTLQGLPPLPAQLLSTPVGDSKLVVKVTPLRRSSFAGELFQARISFSLESSQATTSSDRKGTTDSDAQAGAQAAVGNLLRRPSAPATPTGRRSPSQGKPGFKPAHRSAQSLSNPYIPSLQAPPATVGSLPLRSVSLSHAQRSPATKLPAGHPHARKPSYAPSPNGSDNFPTDDLPTMSALRRTSAGSVTNAPPKSPMSPLSSILEGDAQRAASQDEMDDNVASVEDVFSASPIGGAPRFNDGPSPARSFGQPTRPNGHRYRSSLSIGHGPPPSPSPASSALATTPPPSPVPSGSGLIITWSHVQLQATLSPSPQHLPPEALLPLRLSLIHI